MEPEIARRCKSCGAAIRARSAFCPQCGVSAEPGDAAAAPASVPDSVPEIPQQGAIDVKASGESITPTAKTEAAVEANVPTTSAPAQPQAITPDGVRSTDVVSSSAPIESPPPANLPAPDAAKADDASSKRQRVTAAARELVVDGGRQRAEKLRRASNVVLDEAAADPSLRFVLVATALIIISLVLLLLARIL